MLLVETVVGRAFWKSILPLIYPVLYILPLITVGGCTGEGAGGPIISSLSTPTDETGAMGSDQSQGSGLANDGEEDPAISMTVTPTGITAHVNWVHPPDMNVAGYTIHYRKRPVAEPGSEESGFEESSSAELALEESTSEEASSCSSGEYQTVEATAATITGLEPDTQYAFAIRAFNESESLCSNEIVVLTPSAQS